MDCKSSNSVVSISCYPTSNFKYLVHFRAYYTTHISCIYVNVPKHEIDVSNNHYFTNQNTGKLKNTHNSNYTKKIWVLDGEITEVQNFTQ
jgi:hypothetical protein